MKKRITIEQENQLLKDRIKELESQLIQTNIQEKSNMFFNKESTNIKFSKKEEILPLIEKNFIEKPKDHLITKGVFCSFSIPFLTFVYMVFLIIFLGSISEVLGLTDYLFIITSQDNIFKMTLQPYMENFLLTFSPLLSAITTFQWIKYSRNKKNQNFLNEFKLDKFINYSKKTGSIEFKKGMSKKFQEFIQENQLIFNEDTTNPKLISFEENKKVS